MALLILKKASAAKKLVTVSPLATMIDDVGKDVGSALKIVAQIKALQEKLKPFDNKLKALTDMVNEVDDHADDAEYTERGERFQVIVGKKTVSREIVDLKGIRKKLGDDVFFDIASINLRDIDKYITEAEQTKFNLVKKVAGKRKIEVKPLTE
jgi:hypothetical protein